MHAFNVGLRFALNITVKKRTLTEVVSPRGRNYLVKIAEKLTTLRIHFY